MVGEGHHVLTDDDVQALDRRAREAGGDTGWDLQDAVTRMAAELFDRLDEGSGSADFVTDFAAILPAAVIADLLSCCVTTHRLRDFHAHSPATPFYTKRP